MVSASPSGSAETVPPQAARVIAAAARRLNTDFDDMATPCRLAIRRDNDTGGSKVPWRRCHVFEMNCPDQSSPRKWGACAPVHMPERSRPDGRCGFEVRGFAAAEARR